MKSENAIHWAMRRTPHPSRAVMQLPSFIRQGPKCVNLRHLRAKFSFVFEAEAVRGREDELVVDDGAAADAVGRLNHRQPGPHLGHVAVDHSVPELGQVPEGLGSLPVLPRPGLPASAVARTRPNCTLGRP